MSDRCPACDAMILGNEAYCRQCAAPLRSHLPASSQRTRWLIRARALVLVNCLLAIVPLCMMVTPETSLIGGPILIVMAGVLIAVARDARYAAAIKLGVTQICFVLLWVPATWSVRGFQGLAPVAACMVLLVFVGLFVASLCVWRQHPARDLRFQCDNCGYWIREQIVPRCPECGQCFDPARLD